MKKVIIAFMCGGALLLSPLHSKAEPYYLSCSLVSSNQTKNKSSRSPRRPLVVDLEGHTLVVPSQLVGYTVTLEGKSGDAYTSIMMSNRFVIPEELNGIFEITFSNNDMVYSGTIEIK